MAEEDLQPSTTNSFIRDGITILTPPLLVPIVNPEETRPPAGSHSSTAHKTPRSRKQLHNVNRVRGGQQQIVGLAASRRLVTAGR